MAHLAAKDSIPAQTTVFDTNNRKFKIIHWRRPGVFEEHLGFSPENYRQATNDIKPAKLVKPMALKAATKPKKKRPLRSEPPTEPEPVPEELRPNSESC